MTRNNSNNCRINKTNLTRNQKWEFKQLYGHFKPQTIVILHDDVWTRQRKRETESHLIAAQNNITRTNYVKAIIDKTQKSSKHSVMETIR